MTRINENFYQKFCKKFFSIYRFQFNFIKNI